MDITTTAESTISDEVWNAFVESYEADFNVLHALLNDKESFAALNTARPDEAPEPFGSLSNVDDDLDYALTKLHAATAKPLPHPEHPGAKLAKDAGAKIHGTVVHMDSQVQNDADKIKSCKNLDEASAQWLKDCNEKEEATDKALVASNHAFWDPSRNAA
ncbi:hypothetical protein [Salinifilum ghardaiensis]